MIFEALTPKKSSPEVEKLAALFAQAPVPMAILIGPKHTFAFANLSYEKLVDCTGLVGQTVAEAIPEMTSQGIIDLLNQVFNNAKRFEAKARPVRFKHKENEEPFNLYLDFSYDPLKDENAKVIGIIVVAVDVTDRVLTEKKLEKELKRESMQREMSQKQIDSSALIENERRKLQQIFEQAPVGITIVTGPDHVFETVNES